jgi:hypothetical protein
MSVFLLCRFYFLCGIINTLYELYIFTERCMTTLFYLHAFLFGRCDTNDVIEKISVTFYQIKRVTVKIRFGKSLNRKGL